MNTKQIKILLIIVETLLVIGISYLCIFGLRHTTDSDYFARFAEAIFRCITVYIFSIIYFTSLTSSSGPESLFIPYYLVSFIISEIRIFDTFAKCFSYVIIPPMLGVIILIASVLFMCLSLIGYGLHYENRDQAVVSRYQLFSFVLSILIAVWIPKITDYFFVLETTPVRSLMTLTIEINALVFLILIIQDSHSSDLIRHLAVLLLIAGNFINLFFDSNVMNLAATIFTFIGLALITIIVKVNEIKF